MTVEHYLSLAGTLIAAAGLGWRIYRYVSDKPQLVIACEIGRMQSQPDAGIQIGFNITNEGSKSAILAGLAAVQKDGSIREIIPLMEEKLKTGKSFNHFTSDMSIINGDLETFVAWDTLGRKYEYPKDKIKQLLQDKLNSL